MAYIKLIGKRDADPAEGVNIRNLPDADYNIVAAWAAATFFPQGVFVPGDPEASPPVADSYRAPTGAEIYKALTDNVYDDIKRKVEAWKYKQAIAAVQVAPIDLQEP